MQHKNNSMVKKAYKNLVYKTIWIKIEDFKNIKLKPKKKPKQEHMVIKFILIIVVQIYRAYRISDKQMKNYLDDNFFETDKGQVI